jgi:hypothetical protein
MDPVELIYQLSKQPDWLRTALCSGAAFAVGLILGIRLR